MIILNEKKYAEELLEHGFSYFMSLRDLSILAKYFYYQGYNKKEIECKLIEFCYKFNLSFNEIISSWVIKKSLSICRKYNLRIPIEINISKKELDNISQIDNYKYEKILFVMLVCAKNEKYNKTKIKEENKTSKYNNSYYVNSKFTEILKLAKVYASKEERDRILFELNNLGFIQTTHNGSYKINYIEEDDISPLLIVLSDENVIQAYKQWKPIETIKCSECKCTIEKKSNRHTMCENCYKENEKKHTNGRVKKYRDKIKNVTV